MPQSTLKNYPRGLPFRSPPESTPQPVQRRRWTFYLACTAAAGLAVLVVAVLFSMTRTGQPAPEVSNYAQAVPPSPPPPPVSAGLGLAGPATENKTPAAPPVEEKKDKNPRSPAPPAKTSFAKNR